MFKLRKILSLLFVIAFSFLIFSDVSAQTDERKREEIEGECTGAVWAIRHINAALSCRDITFEGHGPEVWEQQRILAQNFLDDVCAPFERGDMSLEDAYAARNDYRAVSLDVEGLEGCACDDSQCDSYLYWFCWVFVNDQNCTSCCIDACSNAGFSCTDPRNHGTCCRGVGFGNGGGNGTGQQLPRPQILGAIPETVQPGETLIIFGYFLTENVTITSGEYSADPPAELNTTESNVQITIPENAITGAYSVTISGEGGSDTEPDVFRVGQEEEEELPPLELPPAQDFGDLIQDIFSWALTLVGAVIFFAFLYAGFLWFTAAGRTGPITKAKEIMTNAIIGAVILLASYLILHTINPDLVKQTFKLPGI